MNTPRPLLRFFLYLFTLLGLAGWLAGCPRQSSPEPLARVELKASQALASFGQALSAGAVYKERLMIGGTPRGELLLILGDAAPRKLSPEPLHQGAITALALSGSGELLLSVGGRTAALWNLPAGQLVRQLRGPQKLTAGTLAGDGALAYFATEGGHVLRWSPQSSAAEAMRGFNCTNWKVTRAQMKLPPERRCKFGIFIDPPEGPPMCSYPVTALVLHQGALIRACREGSLGLYDLKKKQRTGFLAGHLTSITALDRDRLLLARQDGKLKIYNTGNKELSPELARTGPPTAAASSTHLVAVASKGSIRVWTTALTGQPLTLPIKGRAVWLGFPSSPLELVAVMASGQVKAFTLAVAPA